MSENVIRTGRDLAYQGTVLKVYNGSYEIFKWKYRRMGLYSS